MALALRFISGKYQGGEFPLEEGREIVVGRSSELDMVLVEEMVSRRHARLILHGDQLEIEDLGSTNGTFVNGERVSRTYVGEGDRVLIGSNILRVVSIGGRASQMPVPAGPLPEAAPSVAVRRGLVRRPDGATATDVRMTGDLEEIPLPDLLQLFATSKKDGVLLIEVGNNLGTIGLQKGILVDAKIESRDPNVTPIRGAKAVYRMLGWTRGVFELDPPSNVPPESPIRVGVQEALMEGFRQKDELEQLKPRLPPWEASLCSPTVPPPLSGLEGKELSIYRSALNRTVAGAMDASPASDLETAQGLLKLIKRGFLQIR